MMKYKCNSCKIFVNDDDALCMDNSLNPLCPKCTGVLEVACDNDHVCNHQMIPGIKSCDICGEFVCPICGGHNATPVSRITGYLSPVTAWAAGKKRELMDRYRQDIQ